MPDATNCAEVLEAMKAATSQLPVTFDFLRKRLPQFGVDELYRVLDKLCRDRRVNSCSVTREHGTLMLYWPTGGRGGSAFRELKPSAIVKRELQVTKQMEKTGKKPVCADALLRLVRAEAGIYKLTARQRLTDLGYPTHQITEAICRHRKNGRIVEKDGCLFWPEEGASPGEPSGEVPQGAVPAAAPELAPEAPQAEADLPIKKPVEVAQSSRALPVRMEPDSFSCALWSDGRLTVTVPDDFQVALGLGLDDGYTVTLTPEQTRHLVRYLEKMA